MLYGSIAVPKTPSTSPARRLLEALGLHRPELRAWALYDPASAVVLDVVVTAVFPIYYATVVSWGLPVGVGTQRYAVLTTAALGLLAVLAPVLGAIADAAGLRKPMLAAFVAIGASAVGLLYFVGRGEALLASVLFLIANVGTGGAALFHGALLPHVARDDELDRTSTAACALGYVAAGLSLLVLLVVLERPLWFGLAAGPALTPEDEALPARIAFVVVAAWWVGLSIPLLRRVPEGRRTGPLVPSRAFRGSGAGLARSLQALREHPEALRFAAAWLLYGSGIATITRMAVIYGTEMGISSSALLVAVIVVNLVGTPFALLFGAIAARTGVRRAIVLGLAGYALATLLAYFTHSAAQFFALAVLVAAVQGGTQALSRSLFASLLPLDRSAEFFGVLTLAGNVTAMIGPGLFAAVAAATGSSRSAILSILVLFAAGAAVLATVDVDEGKQAARRAATLPPIPGPPLE